MEVLVTNTGVPRKTRDLIANVTHCLAEVSQAPEIVAAQRVLSLGVVWCVGGEREREREREREQR